VCAPARKGIDRAGLFVRKKLLALKTVSIVYFKNAVALY
jgi:hypothetical protein